ncbi:hypothetical protein A2U01_0064620, partial [Trifolium medium]|nr:hypothetical protein [Trifolium medium]
TVVDRPILINGSDCLTAYLIWTVQSELNGCDSLLWENPTAGNPDPLFSR